MIDKKTPHTETHLTEIFKQKDLNEKHFPKLYAYYKHCFEERYEDEYVNWTQEDYEETGDSAHKDALSLTNMFIQDFLGEKAKGQGDDWAFAVASCGEEGEVVYHITFNDMKKTNPELAEQELLIHSGTFGGDENFIKHYIYLFEIKVVFKDLEKRAKKYSEIYKTQSVLGKSEVYIHEYARLLSSGDYNPIYCEEYAYAYDKALKEGKSETYALEFAEIYGEELVDIKARYGITADEDQINYVIEKVDVYMTAWKYS